MKVTIPVNSRAKVSVPRLGLKDAAITESGTTIWKDGAYVGRVAGITGGKQSNDYITFDVGSGRYHFKLTSMHKTDKRSSEPTGLEPPSTVGPGKAVLHLEPIQVQSNLLPNPSVENTEGDGLKH